MIAINQYLFNAYYQMLSENGTGRVHMAVHKDGINNPKLRQYVHDGFITLNISVKACPTLRVEKHGVQFKAAFGGVPMEDFFGWDFIALMAAPENPELGAHKLPLPAVWVGHEDETINVSDIKNLTKVNNFVDPKPKRENPFSVIEGGKE